MLIMNNMTSIIVHSDEKDYERMREWVNKFLAPALVCVHPEGGFQASFPQGRFEGFCRAFEIEEEKS
jgi:hypothetical protein